MMDRVKIIMSELATCQAAHFKDEGKTVGAVYLRSESIGVIACQASAMRAEINKLEWEVERLSKHQIPMDD
jgi:hypothetical protein